ncbi:MAG: RsmD family RNA methyltransferase [Nanopusillaceae archaeon]
MQFKEIKIKEKVKRAIKSGKQVFSTNSIKKIEGKSGDLVKLMYGNSFVAWATINLLDPKHYIRILSYEENYEPVDDLKKKIKEAKKFREKIGYKNHFRLLYSESDFVSGLIIDKYNEIYVLQNVNPFFDKNIEFVKEALIECEGKNITIYEKSIGKNREIARLKPVERFLYGENYETVIEECNKNFFVNIILGQKTGWFLDQRENRKILSNLYTENVLDVFSYSGSLGICVNSDKKTFVEKNKNAVELLKKNLEINKIENFSIYCDNAYSVLKNLTKEKKKYDIVILDPPDLLSEGYKKGIKNITIINAIAIDLIDEGFLITFSCSQDLKENKFLSILKTIIRRKNKKFEIVKRLGQALDHKIIHPHKELEYLKGFIIEIKS